MPSTYSPLRYPGGKTKFYPYIKEIIQYNGLLGETYVEPFAGGAGLALKLLLNNDVTRIVINDFDQAIYAFWYSILNYTDAFCEKILNVEITQKEWQYQREIYRKQNTSSLFDLGFATFFLNRTNISGVIKGGMIGGQNQDGKYKIDARFNKDTLIPKIKRIAIKSESIVLLNQDAKLLLQSKELKRFYKAFINFDPPYVCKGAQLYKKSFCNNDHQELKKLISNSKQKWVVTYDICPLITELYSDYRSRYLDVTYSVKGIQKASEYIFFSDNLILPDEI